jgi:hypothetical protein
MDKVIGAFKKVGEAFNALAGAGLALISAAVVLQVLFGAAVPFISLDVVGNIISITKQLGSEGLVGLAALGVLFALFSRK